jgi:hypothetical protein
VLLAGAPESFMHRLLAAPRMALGVVVLSSLLGVTGCSHQGSQGATVALDPDKDDGLGGTGIESGDVRAAADQIARALRKDLRQPSRVAVLPVQNHTRFRIDPSLVHDHLVHDLTQQSRGRFGIVQVRGSSPPATAQAVLRTELRSLTTSHTSSPSKTPATAPCCGRACTRPSACRPSTSSTAERLPELPAFHV